MKKTLKRDLMPARIKRIKKEITEISHTFVRRRDSKDPQLGIGGFCFDCGKYGEGSMFQAGHWIPDAVGGAILRYHPLNMHGQHGGCNCGYQQEMVKIRYTEAMYRKYGKKVVAGLLALKNRSIKADIIFYEGLKEVYLKGNEKDIIKYLESYK